MANKSKKRTNLMLFFAIFIMMTTFMTFLIFIYYESHKTLVIETKIGKIMGTRVTRQTDQGHTKTVDCFFGIPYAEPPVGNLRFRKPVPKKRLKETLKAFKQQNYCFQRAFKTNKSSSIEGQILKYLPDWSHYFDTNRSEDCLYLNVFVPQSVKNTTVMVWIHGGGFMSGGTNFYDGSILAANRDVIVVSIAYRLGVFGFLSANDSRLPGNYGLHDQLLALHWIRDNIGFFGGNADNVVLFGESAGAMSVGYHLISPLSRNLFSRAILQSGNPLIPMILADSKINTRAVIDLIGDVCPQLVTNETKQVDSDGIDCLRRANATLLYAKFRKAYRKHVGAFTPIEDNDFFVEHPQQMVNKRQFNPNKEILIGTNSAEGVYFADYGPFGKFWSYDSIDSNFTRQTIVRTLNQSLPDDYKAFLNPAVDFLLDGVSNESDSTELWNRYVQIVGDIVFVCSDFLFINQYSASNRTVFYYRFQPTTTFIAGGPKWANGAIHGLEVAFVFGLPFAIQQSFTLREIQLSRTMMTVWTQFAKTGTPSSGSWLPYSQTQPLYMTLDLDSNHMTQGFPGYKCDDYYETAITETRKYVRSGKKFKF